jgi:hypothetical protein
MAKTWRTSGSGQPSTVKELLTLMEAVFAEIEILSPRTTLGIVSVQL